MTERSATGGSREFNDLPDSAFAIVLPGGSKDSSGKTSPRNLRRFPHHDVSGKLDSGRAADMLGEARGSDIDEEQQAKAVAHLEAHGAERAELPAGVERRTIASAPANIRTIEDREGAPRPGSTGRIFEGYGALFNSKTIIGEGSPFAFAEKIAPGAFRASLASDDQVMLFNHDPNNLLGRKSAGTLRAREDQHGLWVSDDLPDTQTGRDVGVSTERGDITGMSFSFLATEERWTGTPPNETREILAAEVFDIGPVTFPAYTDTTASVRSAVIGRRNAPEHHDREQRAEDPEDLERGAALAGDVASPDADTAPTVGVAHAEDVAAAEDAEEHRDAWEIEQNDLLRRYGESRFG